MFLLVIFVLFVVVAAIGAFFGVLEVPKGGSEGLSLWGAHLEPRRLAFLACW
jgi:hypothetical protein